MTNTAPHTREFPLAAGVPLGLGLGGFFDGIVFHQVLQWHHMLTSAGYPASSVHNLEVNTWWDGLFHISTYLFVLFGLLLTWRAVHRGHRRWSGRRFVGSIFMGFGLFNLVEGLIDHHLLGIHHVNETVPQQQWIYWDLAFLVWGALMLLGGCWLTRQARSLW